MGGGSFIYPSNFAWLLRHVYEDTRLAGIGGVQLISGGLLGHDIGGVAVTVDTPEGRRTVTKRGSFQVQRQPSFDKGEGAVKPTATAPGLLGESGADYLRATYQYGISVAGWNQIKSRYYTYPLDGIGQHIYVDQGGITSPAKITLYLQAVRDAYMAYEGSGKPRQTHVTEFGWQTPSVSEATQASNLRIAYGVCRQTAYVARGYWFFIHDSPEASLFFGLVRADNSLKPAFFAYQIAASGSLLMRGA